MQRLFEFDEHIGDWRVLVQSRDIKNGTIQGRHIAPEAVSGEKIGDGEIKGRHIAPESIAAENIGNGEIKGKHIAPGAVTRDKIAPGSIDDIYAVFENLIENYRPIVINGDVTNAPDEVDLTSTPDNLLKLKDKSYNPLVFSGLGKKYLRQNFMPNQNCKSFDGFVEDVETQGTLSGTPDAIFWDRINEVFVAKKGDLYYSAWTGNDDYVPVSTELIYVYATTSVPYKWDGTDFYVADDVYPDLKNYLTQEMFEDGEGNPLTNTIFVIKYDFDLDGETIAIPENCVLEFDGGSLRNGVLSGEIYTTKGYIDFQEIGGIYEDNTKGGHNRNCLTILSGITNKVSLMFSKDVYLSGTTSTALFQSLELFGNKSKVYCNAFNRFFVSKDLTIHGLHFVSSNTCTLFQLDNSKNASHIHIYDNVFEGDARIFNCNRDLSRIKDSYQSKEESFDYCIESLVVENNIFDNVFNKDGSRMLFKLMDSYVNYTRFSNNQVHNFYASILYFGVDNDGVDNYGNTYTSLIADNYVTKGRKIIITDNIIHNDLLWKPWEIDGNLGSYYCIALCESGDLVFENNSVQNILSLTAKPVYDVYQATNTVVYRNNVIKNVASLNADSQYNTIIKAKSGGTYKHYTGNSFILEDLQTIFELNHPIVPKLLDNEGGGLDSLVIESNVFNIHDLLFNSNSVSRSVNIVFKNNNINVTNAYPKGTYALLNSGNIEGVKEIAYNSVYVDNLVEDNGAKGIPLLCDYADSRLNCHDNKLKNVGLSVPFDNSYNGKESIFKDNIITFDIDLNGYSPIFFERLFQCLVDNNKIEISGTQTSDTIRFIRLLSPNFDYKVTVKAVNIGIDGLYIPLIPSPNIDYGYIGNGIYEGIIRVYDKANNTEGLYDFLLDRSSKYIKFYSTSGELVSHAINQGNAYICDLNGGNSVVRVNYGGKELHLYLANNTEYDISFSLHEAKSYDYMQYCPKIGTLANIPTTLSQKKVENLGKKYTTNDIPGKELTFLRPKRNGNPEWTDSSIAGSTGVVFTDNPATSLDEMLVFYVKYHTNLALYYSKVSANPTNDDLIAIPKTASNYSYTTSISPDPSVYPYIYIRNGNSSINEVRIYKTGTPWFEEDGAEAGVARSGVSASRPVGSSIYVGFMYMDIEAGKPIYASAISGDTVTWVDATGATV